VDTSYIEISRSALQNNIRFIRELIGKEVVFNSVIKGNAYGHGIEPFVKMALECGIENFSVYNIEEAVTWWEVSEGKGRLMILGGIIDEDQIAWAIEKGIEFYVFEMESLAKAIEVAQKKNKKAKIHLQIETGMYRTGFDEEKLYDVARLLLNHSEHLEFMGLCTHFAGAESVANYLRIRGQYQKYKRISYGMLSQFKLKPKYYHTACSAALIRYPKTRMDMVRSGILQYGFWPSKETFISWSQAEERMTDPLRRVLSWKSYVISIKSVPAGSFVGYGTSYLTNIDMKIAVVPVGYGYGYSRKLSNQGRVLINGKRVAVIGIVNMNMISVDVTGVESIAIGDEVVLIGSQGDLEISVASFAELSNQLNYEMLTRLPRDIKRKIID
jgi:alanine racemase